MLGDELNRTRLAKGMSQEELAARAGLTREYISKLENNHSSPTVETLLMICRVLNVPASSLISRIEK